MVEESLIGLIEAPSWLYLFARDKKTDRAREKYSDKQRNRGTERK